MTRIATGSATAVAGDHATFKALSNNFAIDIISTQSAIKSSGVMKGYLAAYISTVDNLSSFTSRAIELAVLGANDTNTDAEAAAIDQEALAIINEMIRISNSEYKGKIFFEQNSHSEFLSMGGRGAEYEVTLGTALAEVLAIYDFDSLRLRIKPSDALTDTDGDGVVDTDAFTSKLEDLQKALNQMRVNAASDYAALEEAQILMTDLNVEYQKGFDIFSQINFSAETASLAKNQILQSAANAMLIQAKNAQAGLIKLID
jgi:flagellin